MKKTFLVSIILLIFSVFMIISCQKELDPFTPETIDSVKSILPKQMVWNEELGGEDVFVLSIKYDTANYRIELYEEDTTNSIPYDRLAIAYNYNKDGYVISFETNFLQEFWLGIFNEGTAKIKRDADNKIIYIAYDDKDRGKKDTSFYKYESISGGMNITSSGSSNTYFEDNSVYNYDKNYRLLSYQGYSNVTFSYNTNNSLHKMIIDGYGNTVSDFAYKSGLPDAKEDMLYKLLLGKDYYLWDLKEMYPFTFYLIPDFDDYLISATNQYHLTSMKDTYQTSDETTESQEGTLTYELNGNKLLSKVVFKVDGRIEGSLRLKY